MGIGIKDRDRPGLLAKVIILLLSVGLFSCGNETTIDYYDTGEIKSIHEVRANVYDGAFKEYFKNGLLKKKGNFVDGKLDGTIQTYFDSGGIEDIMEYRNGKLNGPSHGYFESGNLYYETEFVDGVRTGWTVNFFDDTLKTVKEQKLYNAGGKIVYLKAFDSRGRIILNQITPYLTLKKDTLNYDERIEGTVHLEFVTPKTIVYIGVPDETLGLLDTLAIDTLGMGKMTASFSVLIHNTGRTRIGCVFSNSSPEGDSTNLRNVSPSRWIFIGKPGDKSS